MSSSTSGCFIDESLLCMWQKKILCNYVYIHIFTHWFANIYILYVEVPLAFCQSICLFRNLVVCHQNPLWSPNKGATISHAATTTGSPGHLRAVCQIFGGLGYSDGTSQNFEPARWGPLTTISGFIPSYTHLQPWLNRVWWGYNYLITRGGPFLWHPKAIWVSNEESNFLNSSSWNLRCVSSVGVSFLIHQLLTSSIFQFLGLVAHTHTHTHTLQFEKC